MISGLITLWRDNIWQQTVDLRKTKEPASRELKITAIEQQTLNRASPLLLDDGRIDLFGMLEIELLASNINQGALISYR